MPVKAAEPLSPLSQQARDYYETHLRAQLEREHLGEAVAIHVVSGDYALGPDHARAAQALLTRHPVDGQIVTLTIGPPTAADLRLSSRAEASRKG